MTFEQLSKAKNLEAAIRSLQGNIDTYNKIYESPEIMIIGYNPKIHEAIRGITMDKGVVQPIYVSGDTKKILFDALKSKEQLRLDELKKELEDI